jgi:hypothetical protein
MGNEVPGVFGQLAPEALVRSEGRKTRYAPVPSTYR